MGVVGGVEGGEGGRGGRGRAEMEREGESNCYVLNVGLNGDFDEAVRRKGEVVKKSAEALRRALPVAPIGPPTSFHPKQPSPGAQARQKQKKY